MVQHVQDGHVWSWNWAAEPPKPPSIFFSLVNGITCLSWESGENPKRILAGTTDGVLALLSVSPGESQARIELCMKVAIFFFFVGGAFVLCYYYNCQIVALLLLVFGFYEFCFRLATSQEPAF